MEYHPIANAFPLMTGDSYTSLVKSIREHGLKEPIITYEGKILDGRNRARACVLAGVTPVYREWVSQGETPAEYVWIANAERRQLTIGQRAMAAQSLLPYLKAEAKERQGARTDLLNIPANSEECSDPTQPGTRAGEAAQHVAKFTGVGATAIYEAKRLTEMAKADPKAAQIVQQVNDGTMTLHGASVALTGKQRPAKRQLPITQTDSAHDPDLAYLLSQDDDGPAPDEKPQTSPDISAREGISGREFLDVGWRISSLRRAIGKIPAPGIPLQEYIDEWWDGTEPKEFYETREAFRWLFTEFVPMIKPTYDKCEHQTPPMVAWREQHPD